jgi:hypothetical protein
LHPGDLHVDTIPKTIGYADPRLARVLGEGDIPLIVVQFPSVKPTGDSVVAHPNSVFNLRTVRYDWSLKSKGKSPVKPPASEIKPHPKDVKAVTEQSLFRARDNVTNFHSDLFQVLPSRRL